MHCSSVAEVSDQADVQTFQSTQFRADREQIEHGLGWMLPCSISGIQDRHFRKLGGQFSSAFTRVSQYHSIGVTADHADRVGQRFALDDRSGLRSGEADHPTSEPVHRCLEGEPGPGGWLKKYGCQYFAFEDLGNGLPPGDIDHGLSPVQNVNNLLCRE